MTTIIGQDTLIKHIDNLYQNNKFPGTSIIYGPRGVGKTLIAKYIIDKLLGKSHEFSPDYMSIGDEGGSSIGIDEIRNAKKFFTQTSAQNGAKILLLEPAESLTIQASNAFLKLLEEASPHVYIIIITHHIHSLLPTILSRCVKFKACVLEKDDVKHYSNLLHIDEINFRLANFLIGTAKYYQDNDIALYYQAFLDIIKVDDETAKIQKIWEFANQVVSYKQNDFWHIFIELVRNFTVHAIRCKLQPSLCYPEWEANALKIIGKLSTEEILAWSEDITAKCMKAYTSHLDTKHVALSLFN